MPDADATTTTIAAEPSARPLPDGWRWERLDQVGTFDSGGTPPKEESDYWDGSIPFVTGADITDFYISAQHARSFITEVALVSGRTAICEPGTVLFVTRTRVGRIGIATETMGASQDLSPYKCGDSVVPEYICWYLRSQAQLLAQNTRGSTIQGLTREFVQSIPIPLPPLAEQRRIAAILAARMAAVERARAAAEAQLAAAKALPAAELRAVFECDEAQAWPRARLGDVADVTGGIQKTPQRAPVQFHCPYLTVRNVQQGALDLDAVEQFELTPAELDRYRLQSGDILVVEGNGSPDQIGRNALFMGEIEDCVHQNHLIRVRVDAANCAYQFVSIFLNSPSGRAQLLEKASSTTGLHTLSVAKIQSLEVVLPPMPAQRHIAIILTARMADIAQLRASLEAELDTINALPAALLRQAFNGEL